MKSSSGQTVRELETKMAAMQQQVLGFYTCDFYLCENKGADQLCSNCTADHHLVFATQIVQFLFFPQI